MTLNIRVIIKISLLYFVEYGCYFACLRVAFAEPFVLCFPSARVMAKESFCAKQLGTIPIPMEGFGEVKFKVLLNIYNALYGLKPPLVRDMTSLSDSIFGSMGCLMRIGDNNADIGQKAGFGKSSISSCISACYNNISCLFMRNRG